MLRHLTILVAAVLSVGALAQPADPAIEKEKKEIKRLEARHKATEAAFTKAPRSQAAKKAHVEATVRLATTVMNARSLAPKDKYPRALRLYRQALKLDPANKEAKANSKMIEDIYKSLGRPIPK
jgi:tetratricopeptide (TPR) repeat protein